MAVGGGFGRHCFLEGLECETDRIPIGLDKAPALRCKERPVISYKTENKDTFDPAIPVCGFQEQTYRIRLLLEPYSSCA